MLFFFIDNVMLALVMTLSVTGCKKKSLLEGTILEESRVFNCDDKIVVGVYEEKIGSEHKHYKDIVSGITFSKSDDCKDTSIMTFAKIKELGLISNFLTEEELLKATSNELTEEDISKILMRVTTQEQQKEKNSKKLTLTGK